MSRQSFKRQDVLQNVIPGEDNELIRERTRGMRKLNLSLASALLLVLCFSSFASQQEDAAANAIAAAFSNARQAAHLSRLQRRGENAFRSQVCRNDMRFPSGLIENVTYETSDPNELPLAAQRLAAKPDNGKTAVRFGIGVCLRKTDSSGHPTYSVVIATYESRRTSFWRIFWD